MLPRLHHHHHMSEPHVWPFQSKFLSRLQRACDMLLRLRSWPGEVRPGPASRQAGRAALPTLLLALSSRARAAALVWPAALCIAWCRRSSAVHVGEAPQKCTLPKVTCRHTHLQPRRLPGAAAHQRCMWQRCPAEPAAPAAGPAGSGCPCAACWLPYLQCRSGGFGNGPTQVALGCQMLMNLVLLWIQIGNVEGVCCTQRLQEQH